MQCQKGDHVLYDGKCHRVTYANAEIVVFRRNSDGHMMTRTPPELANEQVPWINTGKGWWSQMRDVMTPQAIAV